MSQGQGKFNQSIHTPTKCSDDQPLVEYDKQLPQEENKKWENVLELRLWYKYQHLKKVFSLCHIYFSHNEHVPIRFWYIFIKRKLNLTKQEKFLTSYLYHKHVCIVDKIDIDSGEDVELVEERTNEINDKTVYANQVQQSQLLARPGLLAGRLSFLITIVNSEIFARILFLQIMLKDMFVKEKKILE